MKYNKVTNTSLHVQNMYNSRLHVHCIDNFKIRVTRSYCESKTYVHVHNYTCTVHYTLQFYTYMYIKHINYINVHLHVHVCALNDLRKTEVMDQFNMVFQMIT